MNNLHWGYYKKDCGESFDVLDDYGFNDVQQVLLIKNCFRREEY